MNITIQKDKLLDFLYELPSAVQAKLDAGGIDIIMLLHDIGGARGLIISEIWWLYEGTRQILAGEASATTLPDFIKPNLEEENQPNAGVIADDIQKKILDKVVPIFKEAGLTVKEGRVPTPPPPPAPKPVLSAVVVPMSALQPMREVGAPSDSSFTKGGARVGEGGGFANPSLPQKAGLPLGKGELQSAGMDEKNIRALTRIASGTTYPEQKLREAFEDLPQGLRQAISSVDTANTIQTIAKKYFLHVDQMASLASETGLVLLGLTHPADFIANLAKRLRVPEDRAKEIARDISAQILGKVRDALRGLHESPLESLDSRRLGVPPSSAGRLISPNKGSTVVFDRRGVTTPALADSGTPFSKGDIPPTLPSKLSVLSNQAEMTPLQKVNTPYGVSANWKTEETPSRDEVMKGIENPREIVGPTGWRPAGNNQAPRNNNQQPVRPISPFPPNNTPQTAFPKYPINKLETVSTKPSVPSATQPAQRPTAEVRVPISAQPSSMPVKLKPASESTTTPNPSLESLPANRQAGRGGGEETFLDQKLQAPMSIPKEEKRYTSDPYREPLQ